MVKSLLAAAVAAFWLLSHSASANDGMCDAQVVQVLFDGSNSVRHIRLSNDEATVLEKVIKDGLSKAVKNLPGQTSLLASFEFSLSVWAGTGVFVESIPWRSLRSDVDAEAVTAQIAAIAARYKYSHPASALMRGATSFKDSKTAKKADSRVLVIISDADSSGWSLGDLTADILNLLFKKEKIYVVPIVVGRGIRLWKFPDRHDIPPFQNFPTKAAVDFFSAVSTFGETYFANTPEALAAIMLEKIEYLRCIAG